MRSDLPDPVRAAIAAAQRPSLIFDTARIIANAQRFRVEGITTLFAVKSFPQLVPLLVPHVDGFDVASPGEAELVRGRARIVSIADPTGVTRDVPCERAIIVCETPEQVAAAPAYAEIAIRVSMSITGRDPAVGAIEMAGHHQSRFGVATRDEVAAMCAGRRVGLHVHHGPVTPTSGERFIATARAALDLATSTGLTPTFIDLGGAWHAIVDVPRTLAEVRAAIPRDVEVIVEPGRALVNDAGFACGRVMVAREVDGRPLRVVDISRICHLRWSQVELVVEHPGRGVATTFVGPTCFEEDVLGTWTCEPPRVGDPIILRNVTGYAAGWNTSFGGVPSAEMILCGYQPVGIDRPCS